MSKFPPQYAALMAAWAGAPERLVRHPRPARRRAVHRLARLVRRGEAAVAIPDPAAKQSTAVRSEGRPAAI